MGCTASTQSETQWAANNENDNKNNGRKQPDYAQIEKIQDNKLEKLMQQRKANLKNQVKMLLLGAGESGKSTVLKQMKLIHKNGFTMQERIQYKNIIWADCVSNIQKLIIQARNFGIVLDCDNPDSNLYEFGQQILNYKPLQDIDTVAAGGVGFLKDHIGKYSEKVIKNRKLNSNGKADAGWEDDILHNNCFISDVSLDKFRETDEILREYLDNSTVNYSEVKTYTRLEIAEAITQLWNFDRGIKSCSNKSNLFQFETSAPYFFENALNYANEDYICTDEDILKGRIKTTGITETNFNINGYKFKILDAGGQRSERKKWIHCFQDITCACFVLAVSEYDQMLFEDERVNRMHEAIMLFDSLVNSKWFSNTPFILFLNKVDLLKNKVRRSPVRKYFPDYKGKSNDVEDTLQYFENLFLSLNRSKRPIYVHRTCATDTKSMQFILMAVTDMVIQKNLKKSGLF